MSGEASVEFLRSAFVAYAAMDIAAIDRLLAPDVVMHIPGRHPLAGDKVGKEEVWAYLGEVAQISGGTGGYEVRALAGDEEYGFAYLTATIRSFVRPTVHVWRIRGGVGVEFWEASLDQHAEDEFWTNAHPS